MTSSSSILHILECSNFLSSHYSEVVIGLEFPILLLICFNRWHKSEISLEEGQWSRQIRVLITGSWQSEQIWLETLQGTRSTAGSCWQPSKKQDLSWEAVGHVGEIKIDWNSEEITRAQVGINGRIKQERELIQEVVRNCSRACVCQIFCRHHISDRHMRAHCWVSAGDFLGVWSPDLAAPFGGGVTCKLPATREMVQGISEGHWKDIQLLAFLSPGFLTIALMPCEEWSLKRY